MIQVSNIRPRGPYVLAQRLDVEQVSSGGLVLPAAQVEKSLRCRVLAVGDGEWVKDTFVKSDIEPGQIVLIRQFDGHKLPLSLGKSLLLVHHELIESKEVNEPWPKGARDEACCNERERGRV